MAKKDMLTAIRGGAQKLRVAPGRGLRLPARTEPNLRGGTLGVKLHSCREGLHLSVKIFVGGGHSAHWPPQGRYHAFPEWFPCFCGSRGQDWSQIQTQNKTPKAINFKLCWQFR